MVSAASPIEAPNIAPTLNSTNASPAAHSSPTMPTSAKSLTTKTWVIPPRPKPGRKPAVDAPPTKRKAQNRAAQRAFRERRIAKVTELSGQVEELEQEHAAEMDALKGEMAAMEKRMDERFRDGMGAYESDVRQLEGTVAVWKAKCEGLLAELVEEQRKRVAAERQLALSRGEMVSLPSRSREHQVESRGDVNGVGNVQQELYAPPSVAVGCGRCTLQRCECIEGEKDVETSGEPTSNPYKRQPSPLPSVVETNKRLRLQTDHANFDAIEIDFTTSRAPLPGSVSATSNPALNELAAVPPAEPCGFCQEGSTCLCAELAAEQAQDTSSHEDQDAISIPAESRNYVRKISADATRSTGIRNSDANLAAPSSRSTCANEPGTCAQCQSNPHSTLFCKSLAATRAAPAQARQPPLTPSTASVNASAAPCPLGTACCRVSDTLSAATSGVARTSLDASHAAQSSSPRGPVPAADLDLDVGASAVPIARRQAVLTGPTLSCADAFTALSRHPAFERASRDLGEWLPRLATIPNVGADASAETGGEGEGVDGRKKVDRDGGVGGGDGSGVNSANGVDGLNGTDGSNGTDGLSRTKGVSHRNPNLANRTAFEIEAASVMGVLRFFDRRFGSDGAVDGGAS